MSIPFYDALRFLVVVLWITNLLLTGMVAFLYSQTLPYRPMKPSKHFMVRHVVLIGCSYTLFATGSVLTTFLRVGQPPSWHLWLNLLGTFLGSLALTSVLLHERRWLHHSDYEPPVEDGAIDERPSRDQEHGEMAAGEVPGGLAE